MSKNKLLKRHNKLYEELTATFTDKKQFTILNKLLDSEGDLRLLEGE